MGGRAHSNTVTSKTLYTLKIAMAPPAEAGTPYLVSNQPCCGSQTRAPLRQAGCALLTCIEDRISRGAATGPTCCGLNLDHPCPANRSSAMIADSKSCQPAAIEIVRIVKKGDGDIWTPRRRLRGNPSQPRASENHDEDRDHEHIPGSAHSYPWQPDLVSQTITKARESKFNQLPADGGWASVIRK